MTYINRELESKLIAMAQGFPVVSINGPRQSGKSTLVQHAFPDYTYISLEDIDRRERANDDPRGFLSLYGERLIIDEAQYAPDLFSYIQTRVDEVNRPGMYVLSGSQNFLMMKEIGQSLAGRVSVQTLLPFSYSEIKDSEFKPETTCQWLMNGGYPRAIVGRLAPTDFYDGYLQTYLERDIRNETSVRDIAKFHNFLQACAARVGAPINLSDVGRGIGADQRTVSAWLSMLEESYIVFRLAPYYRSIANRHTKTAKLYFYDTGLLCSLLEIESAAHLRQSSYYGAVFENAIIAEVFKRKFHAGRRPSAFFWRNPKNKDTEIDLILESSERLSLYEIKASETANRRHLDSFNKIELDTQKQTTRSIIYDGETLGDYLGVRFINWRDLAE